MTGVDVQIPMGQVVGLVGASGAGKTSLFRLVSGAVQPTAGEVHVLGVDVGRATTGVLRTLRRRMAQVHQNDALVPGLRVVHNVLIGRLGHWSWWQSLWSLWRPRELATARAALARMGIEDKLHAPIESLSGGQRQRVSLARLLVQQPELVLADEPSTSLDPRLARDAVELLMGLARERGQTLWISLHDLELLDLPFDRLIGLRAGRVEFDGLPSAFDAEQRRRLFAAENG